MKEPAASLDESNNGFGDDFDDFEEGAEAGMDDDFGDFDDGFEEPAIADETHPKDHGREQEPQLHSFVSSHDLTRLSISVPHFDVLLYYLCSCFPASD